MKKYRFYTTFGGFLILALSVVLLLQRSELGNENFVLYDYFNVDKAVESVSGNIGISDNSVGDILAIHTNNESDYDDWQFEYDPVYKSLCVYCPLNNGLEKKDADNVSKYASGIWVECDASMIESSEYYSDFEYICLKITFNEYCYIDTMSVSRDENILIPIYDYSNVSSHYIIIDEMDNSVSSNGWNQKNVLDGVAKQYKEGISGSLADYEVIVLNYRPENANYAEAKKMFIDNIGAELYLQISVNETLVNNESETVTYYNEHCFIPILDSIVFADLLERNVVMKLGGNAKGILPEYEGYTVDILTVPCARILLGVDMASNGNYSINSESYIKYAAEGLVNGTMDALCNKN